MFFANLLHDGAMLATLARAQDVERAVGLVAEGAERAGRRMGEIEIISRVDTCVHPDREKESRIV